MIVFYNLIGSPNCTINIAKTRTTDIDKKKVYEDISRTFTFHVIATVEESKNRQLQSEYEFI